MKFREPTKLHRKIGGVGHPAGVAGVEPKNANLLSARASEYPVAFSETYPATNRRVPHPSRSTRRVG
jgi:hypothetical protein